MSSLAAGLLILLQLRLRLLLRGGSTGRGGPSSRRTSVLVRVIVLAALALWLSFTVSGLLSRMVSGPLGRLLLAPLLTWLSSWGTLLLFLLAMPTVLGALTYRSDLKLLLLTPLSPRLILAEKFCSVLAGFGLPLLVMGLLILFAVGQALGLGPGYDLAALAALLLLPIAPLSLAMLLAVAVLRWVPPARARNVAAILGALLAIAIYVGTQLLAGQSGARGAGTLDAALAQIHGTWWSTLPPAWPGRALAAAGLGQTGTALTYLAGTALLALFLAALTIMLSAQLFATGWATYQEVGRRSRPRAALAEPSPLRGARSATESAFGGTVAATAAPVSADAAPGAGAAMPSRAQALPATGSVHALRPAWWPLIGKEWRTLRRDPQVWARLLYPLFIMGFWFYRTFSPGAVATGRTVPLLNVGLFYGTLTFVTYFLVTFLALPLINREGRSLYLLALAPLTARDILLAKWTFCVLPVLVLVEGLVVAGAVILRLPPGETLLGALAFAGLVVALAGTLLLVSLLWPRLDWDNPRRQVSGTATLAGSIGGLLLAGGAYGLLILTLAWSSSRPVAALAAGAGIFALTGLVSAAVATVAPRRLTVLLTQ